MNNFSDHGGGIGTSGGSLTLRNVTISSNSGGLGGGIWISASGGPLVTLQYVTLAGNSAASGGGIHKSSGTINLKNTIVSGSSPDNCVGAVTSLGYNLSSDNSCTPYLNQPTDWNNTYPYLGVLTDNGGFTRTHMPFPPSKAIDSGQCIGGITTDQRGVTRPMGLACEIGAVEVSPSVSRIFLPMLLH